MVVVAAVDLARVRAGLRQLDRRRAAELAAPDDQRVLQHAALLQVLEQRRDALVALLREAAVVDGDVVVVVPRLALAVPDLHEAHALLQQAPGDQQLPGVHAGAVHLAEPSAAPCDTSKASDASICMR